MTRPRVAVTLEQCWHRVPGGTAVSAMKSAEAVEAVGEVHQIGLSAHHRNRPDAPWVPPIHVEQLRVPRRLMYECWAGFRWPSVDDATGPVDVIHATGIAVPPRTAPLVVTVHDLAFLRWPEMFTRNGVRFFRRNLEVAKREADIVLCPSDATARDAENAGLSPDRVRVIPWGVDQARASDGDVERVRRRYGLPDRYMLWVGTIEPRKGVPALVDAFRQLGDPDLGLVLAGPSGWHESLPPARPDEPIAAIGFVPPDDLPALYAGAAVFCFPSRLEGFGLPVLEAMAQGTPVVTTAGTATEEVLGDGGLAVAPEPTSLSTALAKVLADEDEFGMKARKRAAAYTWLQVGESLTTLYQELAK